MPDPTPTPEPGTPPATPPASPSAPPGAAPAPIDVNSIVTQARNSVFAELRRAGVLREGTQRPTNEPPPAAPSSTPVAPAAGADLGRLRQLDRALGRTPHAGRLSDAQYDRLERAFSAEAPNDVPQWVTDYFAGLAPAAAGGNSTPPTNPPAPGAPAAGTSPTTPPASNTGGPAPPTVPTEDTPLWRMSEQDRAAYLKSKGHAAYRAKYYADLRLTKVRVRGY